MSFASSLRWRTCEQYGDQCLSLETLATDEVRNILRLECLSLPEPTARSPPTISICDRSPLGAGGRLTRAGSMLPLHLRRDPRGSHPGPCLCHPDSRWPGARARPWLQKAAAPAPDKASNGPRQIEILFFTLGCDDWDAIGHFSHKLRNPKLPNTTLGLWLVGLRVNALFGCPVPV